MFLSVKLLQRYESWGNPMWPSIQWNFHLGVDLENCWENVDLLKIQSEWLSGSVYNLVEQNSLTAENYTDHSLQSLRTGVLLESKIHKVQKNSWVNRISAVLNSAAVKAQRELWQPHCQLKVRFQIFVLTFSLWLVEIYTYALSNLFKKAKKAKSSFLWGN